MPSPLLKIAFRLALAFTFAMAILPKPPLLPGAPTDKIQHIAAFVILTILASAAFPSASWRAMLLGLATFGALIEIVQAIPALHRSSELADFLADAAAIVITLLIIRRLRRLRYKR